MDADQVAVDFSKMAAKVAAACTAELGRLSAAPLAEIGEHLARQERLLCRVANALDVASSASADQVGKSTRDAPPTEVPPYLTPSALDSEELRGKLREDVLKLQELAMTDAWPGENLWHNDSLLDNSELERAESFDQIGRKKVSPLEDRFAGKELCLSRSQGLPSGYTLKMYEMYEALVALEEPPRTGPVAILIQTNKFQAGVAFMIMANCLFSVVKANVDMNEVASEEPVWSESHIRSLAAVETFFIIFFSIECLIKLYVHRFFFFVNRDRAWNNFDFFLVVTALLDTISEASGTKTINATFFRIFRLLKIIRVARVFRMVRILKELRVIMNSMVASFIALFWSIVMLFFMLTVFSLLALQGLSMHIHTQAQEKGFLEYSQTKEFEDIIKYFGSVSTSTVSFYQAATGGVNWVEFYDLLQAAHPFYGCVFLLYIAFFYFAITNVLTGLIVENVEKLTRREEEDMVLEYRKKNSELLNKVKQLYQKFDVDRSGTISWEEFSALITTPVVQAYFKEIDVDIGDAEVFYNALLDMGNGMEPQLETFLSGCERLRGFATSIDMQSLLGQGRHMHQRMMHIGRRVDRSERLAGVALALLTRHMELPPLAAEMATDPSNPGGANFSLGASGAFARADADTICV